MCCLSNDTCKWLDVQVFSDKVTWLAGDVKEPTHYSIRVGNVVPGVVVYLVIYIIPHHGLGGFSGLINGLIAAARGALVC